MAETVLAVAAASWGIVMGISPGLQIRRMLARGSSRDVSVSYYVVLMIGFVLWIGYGVAASNLALIVPNSVALLVAVGTVLVARRLRAEVPSER